MCPSLEGERGSIFVSDLAGDSEMGREEDVGDQKETNPEMERDVEKCD